MFSNVTSLKADLCFFMCRKVLNGTTAGVNLHHLQDILHHPFARLVIFRHTLMILIMACDALIDKEALCYLGKSMFHCTFLFCFRNDILLKDNR